MTLWAKRLAVIALSALACPFMPAVAQPAKVPLISVLNSSEANSPFAQGLRQGLRELGYSEGESILIEWNPQEGYGPELKQVAQDLVRLKAELVVVFNTPDARAMLDNTTIPVVYMAGDPVGAGLAATLARPGGNGTGISIMVIELTAKRLEILHEIAPRARRIGVLFNSSNPMGNTQIQEALKASRILGVELKLLDAKNLGELNRALQSVSLKNVGAVLVTGDGLFIKNRAKIAHVMRSEKIPAIYPTLAYHDAGVLVTYGPNVKEASRKLATYVDRILKGTKPADLPVEQMSRYELIINERIAKEMKLPIPQTLLMRADELIQ